MIKIAYIISAVLFIFGLKYMAHPRTAVKGNRFGAAGMGLAVFVTLFSSGISGYWLIFLGAAIGIGIGVYLAESVEMTGMPELVALFNGMGGAASVLVAGAELLRSSATARNTEVVDAVHTVATTDALVAAVLTGIIGAVTFWGSCLLYTSPSPRDATLSRMPSSA